jgi:hypothetical protein
MPKRDKDHEEEVPKESTLKYEGGQGSKTREQQQWQREHKLHDFDEPPEEEQAGGPRHDHVVTRDGGKRINAGRQQHDEADKNAETNRGDRFGHAKDAENDKRDLGPSKGGKGGNSGSPNGG